MKRLISHSLYLRLTFWVMLTVLIVFFIITYFVTATTRRAVVIGYTDNVKSRLEISNQRINSVLVGVEVAVDNTIPEIEEAISNPDQLYHVVQRLLELNPNIVGSAVAFEPYYYASKGRQFSPYAYRTADSTIQTKQLGTREYDYHSMEWYRIPKQLRKERWSEPYYDLGGGEQLMTTYSHPLYDEEGKMYAIVTADISLRWLRRFVRESDVDFNARMLGMDENKENIKIDSEFFATHAYSFIIGKSGTYIVHPLHERILNDTYFKYSAQTKDDKIDDQIGRNMVAGRSGMNEITRDGIRLMIGYAPIERTGWSMATVIPKRPLFSKVQRFSYSVIAMMLIGVLLLFSVCHRLMKRITKPLRLFASSADEIARGNMKASLPDIKTKDEMKRLHDSFGLMQTSLIEQMEELKEVNAQKGRIEGELKVARDIQMSMLPKKYPPYPERDDIDIYGTLTPAKAVGGDLFDFFIRDEKLFFCIGDVSGKGVPASLVMVVILSQFHSISAHEAMPDRIVSMINDTMAENNDSNMFVTFFVGVLDLPTGRLRYCNAGHDRPILIGSGVGQLPCDSNIPVGVMAGWKYSMQQTLIDPQTTLFLYTDGLIEAERINHEQFGEDRLLEEAKALYDSKSFSPVNLMQRMTDAVHAFVGDAEQSDDLTMLAIQYTKYHLEVKLQKSIILPNNIDKVSELATFVDEICESLDFDPVTAMQMNLAIEEAVVNVMSYAYPQGTKGYVNIEAQADEARLKFVITDTGVPFDPTTRAEVDTTLSTEERGIGGLGIHLVRTIMDSINYERVDGKNILTLRKFF